MDTRGRPPRRGKVTTGALLRKLTFGDVLYDGVEGGAQGRLEGEAEDGIDDEVKVAGPVVRHEG